MSDGDDRKDELEREPSAKEPAAAEGVAAEPAAAEPAAAEPAAAEPAAAEPRRPRQRSSATAKAPARGGLSRAAVWAGLALIVGAAGGWFARDARAHTLLLGGATAAEGGSCEAWESKICGELGDEAFACLEAKSAAGLLPPSACDEALDELPATLTKVKEARQVCDALVTKLCADLGDGTQTCQMVREKTHSFPPDRCQQMQENYEQVIGQLRMMEQAQGGMAGMRPAPHGASPHGASPHAAPAPAAPAPAAPAPAQ